MHAIVRPFAKTEPYCAALAALSQSSTHPYTRKSSVG